jgi:hypothetical protein
VGLLMINILVIDDEFSRLEKILNYIKKHYKFEFYTKKRQNRRLFTQILISAHPRQKRLIID